MKLAFSTLGVPGLPVADVLQLAVTHGYHGVELRAHPEEPVHPGIDAGQRADVAAEFKAAGVEVLGLAGYARVAAPGDDDAVLAEIRELLELARDLGAPFIRVFPGGDAEQSVEEADATAARRLGTAAEWGADLGVRVLLETHDSHRTGADALRVLGPVGHRQAGALWDVMHTWLGGEQPSETLAALGPYLGYVQVKDIASAADTTPLPLGAASSRSPSASRSSPGTSGTAGSAGSTRSGGTRPPRRCPNCWPPVTITWRGCSTTRRKRLAARAGRGLGSPGASSPHPALRHALMSPGLAHTLIDVRPLRTSPVFRRLLIGRTVSVLGMFMTMVTVMYQVWDMTHSTVWTGAVGLANAVPTVVVGLFAGSWVDRGDRRRIYLFNTVGQSVCSLLLAVQGFAGHVPVLGVLALVAAQSCFGAVGGPASGVFIPRLLPKDQVAAGLALNTMSFTTMMLVGPALGGLLIGWAASAPATWSTRSPSSSLSTAPSACPRCRPRANRRGPDCTVSWTACVFWPATGWCAARCSPTWPRRSSRCPSASSR